MVRRRSRLSTRKASDRFGKEAEPVSAPKRWIRRQDERLIDQPGLPKPAEADAVGEGDVEKLAEETDEEALEERARQSQRERPRATLRERLPDIRRRIRESGASPPTPSSEPEA